MLRVPYTHCLFAPITTYSRISDYGTDMPLIYWLHQMCFASLRCPHHLIIVLPHCTLRITTFDFVLISRHRVQPVPPTIQRPMDLQVTTPFQAFLDLETGVMLRPSAYLQCTRYLLVLFCQFYVCLLLMCITGPFICVTGLISDLAVILILSSYSLCASYLPYLPV